MKEIWCTINTVLILSVAVYVMWAKDLSSRAYDKCAGLEKKVELQKERCDHLSEIATKKDTIVINVFKTEKYYRTHYAIK